MFIQWLWHEFSAWYLDSLSKQVSFKSEICGGGGGGRGGGVNHIQFCCIYAVCYIHYIDVVRHVTGNDKDYLRKIPRVVW